MNKERLNYIKEKVNMRNMANVMCGFNTDKTDNEILELIHEVEKLQQENKKLKEDKKKVRDYIKNYDIFKEFSFPLMKRDEENQIKSSIDYQFKNDLYKNLATLLGDKE